MSTLSVLVVTPTSGHSRRITEREWERTVPLLDRASRAALMEATFNSSYIEAIVEDLRDPWGREPAMVETPDGPPGDSVEQRDAEALIVAGLSAELGLSLTPRSFALPDRVRVTIDGVADAPTLLVEAWAHQGPPKSAQKAKVVTDALKLLWVDRVLFGGEARKILALADPAAAGHFQGRSWMAAAFRDLGVEVRVVTLPAAVRERIRRAQQRQFR